MLDDPRKALVEQIIKDFESTYQAFMKVERLTAGSIVRIGFLTVAINIVKNDPCPDEDVQSAILKHLKKARIELIDPYSDEVEKIFMSVSKKTRTGL